jgi:hypothetical protein
VNYFTICLGLDRSLTLPSRTKRPRWTVAKYLLGIPLLLAACTGPAQEVPWLGAVASGAQSPVVASDEGSVDGVEQALTPPPAAEPDECLLCHADKERLFTTAAVEEEVIVENEGEG